MSQCRSGWPSPSSILSQLPGGTKSPERRSREHGERARVARAVPRSQVRRARRPHSSVAPSPRAPRSQAAPQGRARRPTAGGDLATWQTGLHRAAGRVVPWPAACDALRDPGSRAHRGGRSPRRCGRRWIAPRASRGARGSRPGVMGARRPRSLARWRTCVIIRRALIVIGLALLGGCAIGASPERAADLRALEAESAARLVAEGELLFRAEPITLADYKGRDGATALLEAGDLRRGIREASKALYLGRTAGPGLVAMAKRDLAYAYNLAGDLERAASYARQAIDEAPPRAEMFRPATPGQVLGPAHKILGDVRLRQHRVKEATAAYENALRVSEPAFVPFVRVSMANAQLADGNVARARDLFREAESAGSPAVRALARRGLGYVALAERRYADAGKWFDAAVAQASGEDQAYERRWAMDGLARALQGIGHL